MKNKMQDVRDILISQMEAIRDADGKDTESLKRELDKGRVLSDIGKVLTATARVEVEAMKIFGGKSSGTGFLQLTDGHKALPDASRPPVRN